MTYLIEIKQSAKKELAHLPHQVADKVIHQIKTLANNPRPDGCKKLKGADHTYRIRVNNYRVVYSLFDQRLIVQVIKISHRKDIYK
ncbi:Addiction module toxin, RelE/StbE family [Crenothrix polyspora]|jgi:mRNA interferase RelE/StbE|uniref:Addiction module toxin, RelE/StbE family n=1 Tax=Crenothrix polyspora TaxID=360316 RepID=A0A1R4H3T8_9GAMM|nr:type II toxin-antitoxin system RelE/ParE family toxin [Crenothrix polyspora]SJM90925.1 Addiction module toxin, RelE/StbE family [Crenothrix polyspora]